MKNYVGCAYKNLFVPETVYDKETALIGCPIAAADMVTTIYRMHTGNFELTLSPQPLADIDCSTIEKLHMALTHSNYGLQSIEDYPFLKARNCLPQPRYQNCKRYLIHNLKSFDHPKEIKREIFNNFIYGYGYPLIGLISSCTWNLERTRMAMDGLALRYPEDMEELPSGNFNHAVLIVGFSTLSKNSMEHGCLRSGLGCRWVFKDGV